MREDEGKGFDRGLRGQGERDKGELRGKGW